MSTRMKVLSAGAAIVFLAVLTGTSLHLGQHPHVYCPERGVFVHIKQSVGGPRTPVPITPDQDRKQDEDKTNHHMVMARGCILELPVSVPTLGVQVEISVRTASEPLLQRTILAQAPKHSPPC